MEPEAARPAAVGDAVRGRGLSRLSLLGLAISVVAVAGVVWASAAAVDQEPAKDDYATASSRTSNAWCPRC